MDLVILALKLTLTQNFKVQKKKIPLGVGHVSVIPDERPSQAASFAPTLAGLLLLIKKSIFMDLAVFSQKTEPKFLSP